MVCSKLKKTKLSEYLRIGEAAELLGVTPDTLRRWEKSGAIMTFRHPVNQYRLYNRKELLRLLEKVSETASSPIR